MDKAKMGMVCLLFFLGLGLVADACTVPLPKPPMWVLDGANEHEYLVGVELDSLFDVSEGTTCACGLSFSSPLPFGSRVDEAFVAVTNRDTHAMTVVDGFNFIPDSDTSSGLSSRTEQNWFGLATTAISSIVQPTVGPNEALKLWYRVTIEEFGDFASVGSIVAASHVPFDPSIAFAPGNVEFATGSAKSNGAPNFEGAHPMTFFTAAVPEPSSLLLAVFAGLGVICRRRR